MTLALTSDKQHYLNPSYASTVANSVLKIATGSTLTTNLENFFAVDSSASNQVWGGEKRADIRSPYTTSSADALEWQRCIIDGITPAESTSPDHATLVMDELYPSWVSNGIGYYGDTAGSPLFLESEFGLEIYNSNGTLVLGSEDIAALYKASYTGSISTTTSQKTLTTDITATGVLTSDIAFIEDLYLDEVQKVSIPSNGIVRYTSTIITDPTPTSWTTIYKITVVSKGDV